MPDPNRAPSGAARTAAARAAHLNQAAQRAIDDPVKLARAARIVRAAIERRRLRLADIVDGPDVPSTTDELVDGSDAA